MILGLLLIAMASGAAASAFFFAMSAPLWATLLAYPATGAAVLLATLAAAGLRGRRHEGSAAHRDPAPVQQPVPRSTTPAVAARTLRSVTSDSLRS